MRCTIPAEATEEIYVFGPCPEMPIGKYGLIAVSVSGYLIFERSLEFRFHLTFYVVHGILY